VAIWQENKGNGDSLEGGETCHAQRIGQENGESSASKSMYKSLSRNKEGMQSFRTSKRVILKKKLPSIKGPKNEATGKSVGIPGQKKANFLGGDRCETGEKKDFNWGGTTAANERSGRLKEKKIRRCLEWGGILQSGGEWNERQNFA